MVKGPLFSLLDARRTPTCGSPSRSPCCRPRRYPVLLSHPQSSYFAVGKIGRDQLQDYARRAGLSVAERRNGSHPISRTSPRRRRRRYNPHMGKGDKRTRRGKIYRATTARNDRIARRRRQRNHLKRWSALLARRRAAERLQLAIKMRALEPERSATRDMLPCSRARRCSKYTRSNASRASRYGRSNATSGNAPGARARRTRAPRHRAALLPRAT